MQINNSSTNLTANPLVSGSQSVQNGTAVNRAELERARRQDNQERAPEQQSQQLPQRLDIDAQALAVVDEQFNQQASNNNQSGANNTFVEQNGLRNQTAVSTYQGVENIEQRANIEQLFGVDLYA